MRYATFSTADDPTPRLGAVFGDRMADARLVLGPPPSSSDVWTLLELVQSGRDTWAESALRLNTAASAQALTAHARLADVRWHAPLPRPRKNVVCLGLPCD
jgi:hypothetical protein